MSHLAVADYIYDMTTLYDTFRHPRCNVIA